MRWLKSLFKKKVQRPLAESEIYAKLGEAGITPNQLRMYQDSVKTIKEYESRLMKN